MTLDADLNNGTLLINGSGFNGSVAVSNTTLRRFLSEGSDSNCTSSEVRPLFQTSHLPHVHLLSGNMSLHDKIGETVAPQVSFPRGCSPGAVCLASSDHAVQRDHVERHAVRQQLAVQLRCVSRSGWRTCPRSHSNSSTLTPPGLFAVPDTVDYFRRGRRAMLRPPLESIPTIVPGAMIGRLVRAPHNMDYPPTRWS